MTARRHWSSHSLLVPSGLAIHCCTTLKAKPMPSAPQLGPHQLFLM